MKLLCKFLLREKKLSFFLIVSIIIIVFRVVLLNTQEYFSRGSEIGSVIYDLSIGYIISWFFFFLVDFVKRQRDMKNMGLFLSKRSFELICDGHEQLALLFPRQYVIAKIKNINGSELKQKFNEGIEKGEKFQSLSRGINKQVNILNAMKSHCDHSIEVINSILSYSSHWDSEFNRILFEINESNFFKEVKENFLGQTNNLKEDDLSDLIEPMIEYLNIIRVLAEYCTRNLEDYRSDYSKRLQYNFIA